jgi:hypothetical protein
MLDTKLITQVTFIVAMTNLTEAVISFLTTIDLSSFMMSPNLNNALHAIII